MSMETPLLTFYGDDFTGSSAVMEVLALAGVPTVMFLDAPTPEMLARLDGVRAIGIAGVARSMSPEWMDAELPRNLAALQALASRLDRPRDGDRPCGDRR
jgi:3-oxoisoapionate kinase